MWQGISYTVQFRWVVSSGFGDLGSDDSRVMCGLVLEFISRVTVVGKKND